MQSITRDPAINEGLVAPRESGTTPLRVLALSHTGPDDCCTFVRIATPLRALLDGGQIEPTIQQLVPWDVAAIRRTLRNLRQWDLIWISRPRHYFMLPVIRAARCLGKPLLVDIDDWLLDVPSQHVDAQFYRTRPCRETVRLALRSADAITTSTPVIAEYGAALGVPTHVLLNAVDCTQFTRRPCRKGPITIAFCGTPSHYDDVRLIVPALRRVLTNQPGHVRVVAVGCPIPELQHLQGYTYQEFVPATEYPRLLSGLGVDIGLAPLQDTFFNRAKSDVKYLEYSATGAATIASPVAPYLASVHENRGIVVHENTPAAWSAAIVRLIEDTELRERLAANAYEWVRSERSIEATAHKWCALFQEYVRRDVAHVPPGAPQLSPEQFARVMVNIVARQIFLDLQRSPERFARDMLAIVVREIRHDALQLGGRLARSARLLARECLRYREP
jgi:glycosyltransferase involved in cell wall biosynthesis